MTSSSRSPRLLIVVACVVILFGVMLELVGLGWVPGTSAVFPNAMQNMLAGGALIVVGMLVVLWARFARKNISAQSEQWARVRAWLVEWNTRDDELSPRRRMVNLALISFLGLFFELALIRWIGLEIKVFAYLKNVVLIAAFLGLGMGFSFARRREGWLPLFLPGALLMFVTVLAGDAVGLWTRIVLPNSEQLVLLGITFSNMQAAPLLVRLISWLPFYIVTLFYFVSVVFVFIPLGQYTGKCMNAFAPLRGYSLNLLGSLAGTLIFTLISFAWLPPIAWFGLAALALVVQLGRRPAILFSANLIAAGVWVLMFIGVPGQLGGAVWSPYNPIVVRPLFGKTLDGGEFEWGYQLGVGQYYYQDVLNLSKQFFERYPNLPAAYRNSEYEVPYKFARPNKVLVLGAGTGNDVAAALRNGAREIVAVEIDPAILLVGQQIHPEHPYHAPGVTMVADDARAYLRQTNEQFDLVAFGLLDSYQVLSAFGSVRLDNFVYTIEGMRDAYARVKPDGLLAVTFEIYEPWIAQRIFGILQTVTGQAPLVIDAHHGTAFLIRKGTPLTLAERDAALAALANQARALDIQPGLVSLTTDDWPYLYMRDRSIPFAYWTMLPILAALSVWLMRRVGGASTKIDWHFFLLGAGFLLMEVRVISQIALLFGSTWLVNAVAIAVILLMAVLANALVAVRKFERMPVWGALLLITLAASSLIPSSVFLGWGQLVGGTAAALLLALPVFFASMIFSISFRKTRAVEIALGSNLIGAILGGLTEYASLVTGIGALAWIAGVFYLLALVAERRKS